MPAIIEEVPSVDAPEQKYPEGSPEGSDGEGGQSGWLGPLLLAAAPFLLFALLFLADRLLR